MLTARTPFRIGIVGCGRIAVRHIEACLASDCVNLVALIDPVGKHAEDLANRFKIKPLITDDLERALPEMDGAIISSPNHLHASCAIPCLNAGISTLIEKPLAASSVQGEAICRAADKTGTTVAVGYVTRFKRHVELFQSLLESNYFGTVQRFAYQSGTRGGWAPLSGYNLDRKATGGGVLVVTGTHFLDRMLNWFGYPTKTTLKSDSEGGPEANAFCEFSFETGACCIEGAARFSKTVSMPPGFVMETERGIVLLGEGATDQIRLHPTDTPRLETLLTERGADELETPLVLFGRQLQNFVSAAQRGEAPKVSGRDGLKSLRLIDELYENSERIETSWYRSAKSEVVVS